MTWYFMQPVYKVGDTISTYGDSKGSTTSSPEESARKQSLREEKKYATSFPETYAITGNMWAVWEFSEKPSLAEAQSQAKTYRPSFLVVALDESRRGLTRFQLYSHMKFEYFQINYDI